MNLKKTLLGIFLALQVLCYTQAHAAGFGAYATADNHFWIWGYSGAGVWDNSLGWYNIPESDYHGWTEAKYFWGELNSAAPFDIYIAAADKDGPGGFMADFRTDSGTFEETGASSLLTNTINWEIINYTPTWLYTGPTFDPRPLSGWITPTSYGTNAQNDYWMWHSPVGYINQSAAWLWTNNIFDDNYVLFHARVTPTGEVVQPPDDYVPPDGYTQNPGDFGQPSDNGNGSNVVPEPATVSLLGLGVLGLVFRRRGQ